jgi:hypothetical protein
MMISQPRLGQEKKGYYLKKKQHRFGVRAAIVCA